MLIALGLALSSSRSVRASYYPIFTPPFSSSKAKDFSLIKNGDQWFVVAINEPVPMPPLDQPENVGLPVSSSYDLEHWTYRGVAVPVGAPGSWDDRSVWAPSIIKSGDTYYLYYAGVQVQGGTLVQKIGLATSTDLVNWTKSPGNPILDCSTLSWTYWNLSDASDGAACRDPYVVRDEANNRWVMFFTANLPHDDTPPYTGIGHPAVIGMATSTDLTTWVDAGYLPATRGYTAESPHVIEHGGTWYLVYTGNCNFQGTTKCLIYSTASALTGPYTGYADLPDVENWHFASDYYRDAGGREVFGRVDIGTVRFSDLDWSDGGFGLTSIPSATFTGLVWNDINRDGIQDPLEPGLNGVKIYAYLDNGDEQFNPSTDFNLANRSTRRAGFNGVAMDGVYTFTFMQPGKTWLVIGDENFDPGQTLEGQTVTTGSNVASYTVTTSETVSSIHYGFALPDTTPPAAVINLTAG